MIKPKKKEVFYDKHFTTIVYEYRGMTYEVNYANGTSVCVTPAYIQHRDEQAKIDKLIDDPIKETEKEPINLDDIWELMEWN